MRPALDFRATHRIQWVARRLSATPVRHGLAWRRESARTGVQFSPAVSSSVLGHGRGTAQQGPESRPSTEKRTRLFVCRCWKLSRGHGLRPRHRPLFLSFRLPHSRAVADDSRLGEDCHVRTLGTVSERLAIQKHVAGRTSGRRPDERTRPPWTPTRSLCVLFIALALSGVM